MADIFVSYKREERSIAERLAAALENEGWSVWWDADLVGGQSFDAVIERELDAAKAVIVLWSTRSVESDYIIAEASYALSEKKVLPVFIEEVRVPFRFRGIHTVNMVGWNGSPQAAKFRELVEDLIANIGPTPRHQARDQALEAARARAEAARKEREVAGGRQKPVRTEVKPQSEKAKELALEQARERAAAARKTRDDAPQRPPQEQVRRAAPKKEAPTQPSSPAAKKSPKKSGLGKAVAAVVLLAVVATGGWFGYSYIEDSNARALLQKEQELWAVAKAGNTVESYEMYLDKYESNPGTYVELARKGIAKVKDRENEFGRLKSEAEFWISIFGSNNIDDYRAYLDKFGDLPGRYAADARNKINQLQALGNRQALLAAEKDLWAKVGNSRNPGDLQQYLDQYGQDPGTFTGAAREKIAALRAAISRDALIAEEKKLWAKVRDSRRARDLQGYLDQFGTNPGTYAKEAKTRLKRLIAVSHKQKLQAEEKAFWARARDSNDASQLQAYLNKYGKNPGTYSAEAGDRLKRLTEAQDWQKLLTEEKAFWDQARKSGDPGQYEAYLRKFGRNPGNYAAIAKERLDVIAKKLAQEKFLAEEKTLWARIQNSSDPAQYEAYLGRFGKQPGTYTAQAQRKLRELTAENEKKVVLAKERGFWSKIKGSRNPDHYHGYLNRFGNNPGTYAREAKAMIKSLTAPAETTVTFVNPSASEPVTVYWVTQEGPEKPYFNLNPGQSQAQGTYVGHEWVVRASSSRKELLRFKARSGNPAVNIPAPKVNGRTVRQVTHDGGSGGVFVAVGGGRWQERSKDGASFNFVEQQRDDWSVYLFDQSRNMRLQLDLHRKLVLWASGSNPMQPLYRIVGSR